MKSIRLTLSAVLTALCYPRVWLTALGLVLAVSAFAVLPVFRELEDVLGHYPGAGMSPDPVTDADLSREVFARVSLVGPTFLMVVLWILLGGGILATVGMREKFSFTDFLADGGRLFMRNLRVIALGLPVLALVFWGLGALSNWITEDALYAEDPGNISVFGYQTHFFSWETLLFGLQVVLGFVFLLVVFASKVAMARLALDNRRSALTAWGVAIGVMFRHPLQSLVVVGLLCTISLLGTFGLGELTALFWEGQQNLLAGAASGLATMVFAQVMLVAWFLAARKLLVAHRGRTDVLTEPVVELPRKRPAMPPKPPARAPLGAKNSAARRA